MKKRRIHIHRILSAVLLWVFAIALTPWSALHHHDQQDVHSAREKVCTHKLHISSHADTCLICAAHFEKDFVQSGTTFRIFLSVQSLPKIHPLISGSYTELIESSLRGPPAV
ncbi:hypothetical protein [Pedobacter nutrimenti]|uniref:hypothetical protein n=1 Tax=Pedobacter nutrimenti TaxID=1241337 RepID=UPI000DA179A8|nr:hypothetical protein [Pedobacter nutrimenti]